MIQVERLSKRFGAVRAIDRLTFSVKRGEIVGFLGPNGAGKTTTIEIIEGLLDATSGEVEVLGMRWGKDDTEIRQRIGISLQETKLSEKLTVRETLTLFRSFYRQGITPDEAIARVSLEEKADVWVGKLSGGQQQRLAVASALVGNPEVLFLDEPTTGLDPQARRQLWDIIRSFREQGRAVLLTTHYMDEAERLCDRVAVVDHGKVIALGSPRALIASLGGEHVVDITLNNEARETDESIDMSAILFEAPAVTAVRQEADHCALSVTEPHLALPAILERLRQNQLELASLTTRHASLEDVFVTLTGRHLRDEAAS